MKIENFFLQEPTVLPIYEATVLSSMYIYVVPIKTNGANTDPRHFMEQDPQVRTVGTVPDPLQRIETNHYTILVVKNRTIVRNSELTI